MSDVSVRLASLHVHPVKSCAVVDLAFGMSAVIVEGVERMLRVGMEGSASYRF